MKTAPNCYWRIKGGLVFSPGWAIEIECGLVEITDLSRNYEKAEIYAKEEVEVRTIFKTYPEAPNNQEGGRHG